jgi:tol-pal system protein YbgF
MMRAPVVVGLALALSTGCASQDDVRIVAADVKDARTQLGAVLVTQGGLLKQVAELEAELKEARTTTEQLQASVATTNSDLARLTQRLDAAEETLSRTGDAVTALAAPPPRPSPSPAPPPPEPARDDRSGTPEKAFAAGLASFRVREYGQAILAFLDIVTKYPRHELAPTAQFWIGESYYLQRDYRQALLEFEKVVDWGSPNPKLADALVKTGLCYSRLRETARAEAAWRRAVREFPETSAAAEARTLLTAPPRR